MRRSPLARKLEDVDDILSIFLTDIRHLRPAIQPDPQDSDESSSSSSLSSSSSSDAAQADGAPMDPDDLPLSSLASAALLKAPPKKKPKAAAKAKAKQGKMTAGQKKRMVEAKEFDWVVERCRQSPEQALKELVDSAIAASENASKGHASAEDAEQEKTSGDMQDESVNVGFKGLFEVLEKLSQTTEPLLCIIHIYSHIHDYSCLTKLFMESTFEQF